MSLADTLWCCRYAGQSNCAHQPHLQHSGSERNSCGNWPKYFHVCNRQQQHTSGNIFLHIYIGRAHSWPHRSLISVVSVPHKTPSSKAFVSWWLMQIGFASFSYLFIPCNGEEHTFREPCQELNSFQMLHRQTCLAAKRCFPGAGNTHLQSNRWVIFVFLLGVLYLRGHSPSITWSQSKKKETNPKTRQIQNLDFSKSLV